MFLSPKADWPTGVQIWLLCTLQTWLLPAYCFPEKKEIAMPVLPPNESPDAVAIASGAVLFALLSKLRDKGALDTADIISLLGTARTGVGARVNNSGGPEAAGLLDMLTRHFTERKI
jgi:hypothetical protein